MSTELEKWESTLSTWEKERIPDTVDGIKENIDPFLETMQEKTDSTLETFQKNHEDEIDNVAPGLSKLSERLNRMRQALSEDYNDKQPSDLVESVTRWLGELENRRDALPNLPPESDPSDAESSEATAAESVQDPAAEPAVDAPGPDAVNAALNGIEESISALSGKVEDISEKVGDMSGKVDAISEDMGSLSKEPPRVTLGFPGIVFLCLSVLNLALLGFLLVTVRRLEKKRRRILPLPGLALLSARFKTAWTASTVFRVT